MPSRCQWQAGGRAGGQAGAELLVGSVRCSSRWGSRHREVRGRCKHTQQAQSPAPRAQPAEPTPGVVEAWTAGPLGTWCQVPTTGPHREE